MAGVVLVALGAVGASCLLSGLILLRLRRARATGLLSAVAGLGVWASVAVAASGRPDLGWLGCLLSSHVGLLALTAYPGLRRRTVYLLALAAVLAVPALVVLVLLVLRTEAPWSPRDWSAAAGYAVLAGLVLLLLLTWWRLEHPDDHDRWALTWLALGVGGPVVVSGVLLFTAERPLTSAAAVATFVLVGPALLAGVRRADLVDVRGLVVGFVVLATALVTYVAALSTLTALVRLTTGSPATAGTVVLLGAGCAVGFHPLQRVLRGVVDEMLFGRRPDPLGAAAQVAGAVGAGPGAALDTVRTALVLPYVALLVGGVEVGASGTPVAHVRSLPVHLDDGAPGELRVGLRPGDLDLSRDDRRVLGLVAPLLGQTLRAQVLAEEVQASRAGTVIALQEERRRVRRDLHDGLGPRLSGIAFTTDAARNRLRSDPAAADTLLAGLRAETVAAIKEVRDIAYGLRPPALDELGLVPAVEQQTARLRTPDGRPFLVRVDADPLPPLPAAVEVAVYRIAVEALTNAARHSGGDTARARLRVDGGRLLLDVHDQGVGETPWPVGVGTASMRERAAEVGGSLSLRPSGSGGAVRAVLPLAGQPSG